jgi:hypothetical protein
MRSNVYVTKAGRTIQMIDIIIQTDIDMYAWKFSGRLTSFDDYFSLEIEDRIILTVYGTSYNLVIDSLEFSKDNIEAPILNMTAISPSIYYHDLSSKVYSGDIVSLSNNYSQNSKYNSASAICNYFINNLSWGITSWNIPAGAISGEEMSPLDIVKRITSAIGASIICDPSGNLAVRYKRSNYSITLSVDREIEAISITKNIRPTKYSSIKVTREVPVNDNKINIITRTSINSSDNEAYKPAVNLHLDTRENGLNSSVENSFEYGDSAYFLLEWENCSVDYYCDFGDISSQGYTTWQTTEYIQINDYKGQLSYICENIIDISTGSGSSSFNYNLINGNKGISVDFQYGFIKISYNVRSLVLKWSCPIPSGIQDSIKCYIYAIGRATLPKDIDSNEDLTEFMNIGEQGARTLNVVDNLLTTNNVINARFEQEKLDYENTQIINLTCTYLPNVAISTKISFDYEGKLFTGYVRSIRHTIDYTKVLTHLELFT